LSHERKSGPATQFADLSAHFLRASSTKKASFLWSCFVVTIMLGADNACAKALNAHQRSYLKFEMGQTDPFRKKPDGRTKRGAAPEKWRPSWFEAPILMFHNHNQPGRQSGALNQSTHNNVPSDIPQLTLTSLSDHNPRVINPSRETNSPNSSKKILSLSTPLASC
jgi:hypothetical protein